MALTPSNMLPLETLAPAFELKDTDGRIVDFHSFSEKPAKVVMFICNHCPYVVHLKQAIAKFADDYQSRGVAVIGINSNDADRYPADSFEQMAVDKQKFGYNFPYLYDDTQGIALAYQAACTPEFYLFNHEDRLVYRGQFDDSRPGNEISVTGKSLREAVDAVLAGERVQEPQIASVGCSIKWKVENDPR